MKNLKHIAALALGLAASTGFPAGAPAAETYPDITLSGLVEIETAVVDNGDEIQDDISLATVELGLAARMNPWLQADLIMLYEEDDTPDPTVDRGTLTFLLPQTPFRLTAGRMTVPFGLFSSLMVSDPPTLELGETKRQTVLEAGYAEQGFSGSFSVYRGDVQRNEDKRINSLAATASYSYETETSFMHIAAGWTNNLSDSDTLQEGFEDGRCTELTGGATVGFEAEFDKWLINAEYLGALERLADGESAGTRPEAFNIEAGRTVKENLLAGARYAWGNDLWIERQYGAVISYYFEPAAISAEIMRNDLENGDDETVFTLQLAAEF